LPHQAVPDSVGRVAAGAHDQPDCRCKNLGTTHITNGCYRLHPIEWNIGEAAGALAAYALDERVAPAAVRERADLLRKFQRRLLGEGIPLAG
jgi:hypothetical protein